MKKRDRKNLFYLMCKKILEINGPSDLDIEYLKKTVPKLDIRFFIHMIFLIILIGTLDFTVAMSDSNIFKYILLAVYYFITSILSWALIELIIVRIEYHKIIKRLKQKENKNGGK